MVAAMMAVVMSAKAEDIEFAYDAGFEAVSCYIWRGQYNGWCIRLEIPQGFS